MQLDGRKSHRNELQLLVVVSFQSFRRQITNGRLWMVLTGSVPPRPSSEKADPDDFPSSLYNGILLTGEGRDERDSRPGSRSREYKTPSRLKIM